MFTNRVLWIAHAADIWVYPFLKVMPHGAKAAFFVMCALVLSSFYLSGKWLTNIVHCQAKEGELYLMPLIHNLLYRISE